MLVFTFVGMLKRGRKLMCYSMIGTQTPMPYRPAPLREADTLFSGSGAGPAVAAGWLLHG